MMQASEKIALTTDGLQALIGTLRDDGYRVIGPSVRDQTIVYDDVETIADLPEGWTDEQKPGQYRLKKRDDAALFGYVVGPHSWKRFLHPPLLSMWTARRDGDTVKIEEPSPEDEKFAFIGARACELNAIAIQDKVFLEGPYVDPHYRSRREGSFLVAVNCAEAGGTCFCASMNTGPKAEAGFDIALTELLGNGPHMFVAEAGSEAGRKILEALPGRAATGEEIKAAENVIAKAATSMGREMPAGDLRELLMSNLEHPRWDDAAKRCLSCANCTMVCPTCFCTSIEDASDLTGNETSRNRRWDSCFTMDYSYVHGGSVRPSTQSRYRQWMTHKLATWHDQFDTSGCVGCGRCITWCPVGIDITEEVRAIKDSGRG